MAITPTANAASSAVVFDQSLGINTHIDFSWSAYNDLSAVQSALYYLGIHNVRDAVDNPADPYKFTQLSQNLGVTFDFFIAPGSAGAPWQLQQIESLPSITRFVEGPNESDNFPQTYNGLTGLAATTAEQQTLYPNVKSTIPGTAVSAPSFGQLSTFSQVGDLSASADTGNAHIYFGSGNPPADQNWITMLIGDANQVAPGEPVNTTETGYYTSTDPSDANGVAPIVQAKYLLDDVMDQFQAGTKMDFIYELVDQQPDPNNTNPELHFGLFNNDWTPKPAAVAVHNLMLLMQDAGTGGIMPGSLSYALNGMPSSGNSLLFEKSDGTFVLALWNEARLSGPTSNTVAMVAGTPVTLTLASAASNIDVFDPLTGTSVIQSASNTNQITVNLPDHPILIEIGANAGPPAAQPPAPAAPAPAPTSPTGVTLALPANQTAGPGQTVAIQGIKLSDDYAAANLGSMSLTISAISGALTMTDAGGNKVAGSGTNTISLDGSYYQLATDLAHLSYTAASSGTSDKVSFNVWDPAGDNATSTLPVAIEGDPVISVPPPMKVATGATTTIEGVSVADTFASSNPVTMVVTLSDQTGQLALTDPGGNRLPGSGTNTITVSGSLAQINADLATLSYVAAGAGSDDITVNATDPRGLENSKSIAVMVNAAAPPPPNGPTITAPGTENVTVGSAASVTGVSITDAFAATNPGMMLLNLSASTGLLTMTDASGSPLPGSGTSSITVTGSLAQINADLATLSYTAADTAGSKDSITADIRDQQGIEAVRSIGINIAAPAPSGPMIAVPAAKDLPAGSAATIGGVSVTDAFAASNPGPMLVNLSANTGSLTVKGANGVAIPGSGTSAIQLVGSLAEINTDLATLSYTAGATTGNDNITVDVWDQQGLESTRGIPVTIGAAVPPPPTPPVISMPTTENVTTGSTTTVTGISITNSFAESSPGAMLLNLSSSSGTLTMTDASGNMLPGSGTNAITVTGSLAQINADLTRLSFTAGSAAGNANITADAFDQLGLESTKSLSVTVQAPSTPTGSTTQLITIPDDQTSATITVSNATINATGGDHTFFLDATGDVLTATGGTETVTASGGDNRITTGNGNDTVKITDTGNSVDAGGGTNEIDDSGSGNTIVLPQGGAGFDNIFGSILQNNDVLDLRFMLAGTQWDGSQASLGNYVAVQTMNGSDSVISVNPTGQSGGASSDVATLHNAGAVTLAALLAHAVT